MKISIIVAAALPLALANPLLPRSYATINKSLNTIFSNLKTLNTTVSTLKAGNPGNFGTVLQIQSQNNNLNDAVDNASKVAKASGNLNDNDSGNIANSVLTLRDQIDQLVNNLVSKKPIFDTVLFNSLSATPQVKKDLLAQQKSALAYGAALTPKLSATYQGIAPLVIGQINDTFNYGINAFSKASGIPIPPFFPTV